VAVRIPKASAITFDLTINIYTLNASSNPCFTTKQKNILVKSFDYINVEHFEDEN